MNFLKRSKPLSIICIILIVGLTINQFLPGLAYNGINPIKVRKGMERGSVFSDYKKDTNNIFDDNTLCQLQGN